MSNEVVLILDDTGQKKFLSVHPTSHINDRNQMSIIRSVTTKHTSALNIEYRIGVHNPTDPSRPKYLVVEVYHRGDDAEWSLIGAYKMDDFIELNRDVVRIGKELIPAQPEAADVADE